MRLGPGRQVKPLPGEPAGNCKLNRLEPGMKLAIVLAISACTVFAAPQDAKSSNASAKSDKTAAAPATDKPLTAIPSSAVQIEPGAYRWTDAKGKKWVLFQTPFGIARKEDTGEPLR